MLQGILSTSSSRAYQRVWEQYGAFAIRHGFRTEPPIGCSELALFIAHLHDKSLAPATITTYVSAISFVHKIGSFNDPTESFIIRKLLKSERRNCPSVDNRLPITKSILQQLIMALQTTTSSKYDLHLFRAMFSLAFHAFLRIGEMTDSSSSPHNNLQLSHISINNEFLEIYLPSL